MRLAKSVAAGPVAGGVTTRTRTRTRTGGVTAIAGARMAKRIGSMETPAVTGLRTRMPGQLIGTRSPAPNPSPRTLRMARLARKSAAGKGAAAGTRTRARGEMAETAGMARVGPRIARHARKASANGAHARIAAVAAGPAAVHAAAARGLPPALAGWWVPVRVPFTTSPAPHPKVWLTFAPPFHPSCPHGRPLNPHAALAATAARSQPATWNAQSWARPINAGLWPGLGAGSAGRLLRRWALGDAAPGPFTTTRICATQWSPL